MDPVCIDTFTDKLKQRVAIKSRITWADQEDRCGWLLGFHPAVFCVPAALAAVLWLSEVLP